MDSVSPKARVDEQWLAFIAQRKTEELERIIAEENLHPEAARRFMDDAFPDGGIASTGTAITQVLPPTSRFGKTADSHTEKNGACCSGWPNTGSALQDSSDEKILLNA